MRKLKLHLAASIAAFLTSQPDAAALDHASACCFQRGVDVLGTGFGLVHSAVFS